MIHLKTLLLLAAVCLSLSSLSQGKSAFEGEIFGNVLDSLTNEPIEYVTVTATKKGEDAIVAGVITEANGQFSLAITEENTYLVKLAFIGYDTKLVEVKIDKSNPTQNLKDFILAPTSLKGIKITGEKPPVRYEIDKKIVNVEDQDINVGQSAAEVLANVPSIQVDDEGNITIRGSSNFMLLINGIPTAMEANNALQSIPASSIKDIEIITNPSAKYDAEGAGGIINIITKKKKLEGISVMANGNYGSFENYGGDVAVSIGKKDVTFNIGGNFNQRHRPRDIEKIRTTQINDSTESIILSNGYGAWKVFGYGLNGEFQWQPNNSHTLIVGGELSKRDMRPYHYLDFREYTNESLVQAYENRQDNIIDINTMSASLFYQYNIKRDKNHFITLKAITNQRDVEQLDSAMYYDDNGEFIGGTKYSEVGPSDFVRFNFDYQRPLKDGGKFQTGAQAQLGTSADDGRSYFWDSTLQEFVFNQAFSSYVDYTRDVYAGYAILNGKKEKFGYQLGLRAEYTHRTIEASNFGDFTTIKRLDWFPSTHFSYDLTKESQVLANYSRRIQRPRSWYFEPFITWETEYNVRSGNPDLVPEYINSFELSWIRQLAKDKSYVTIENYFRSTSNLIERVSTVYQDNVIITRPYNIGTASALGIEPSLQYKVKEWYDLNVGLNIFYFAVSGEIENVDYSANSFNYSARFTNTFKVQKDWVFQLVGSYESPTVNAQGSKLGFYSMDASVRKTLAKGKYTLSLAGKNLLQSKRDHVTIETDNLYLIRRNTPRGPLLTASISVRLNNYKKVASRHEDADDF